MGGRFFHAPVLDFFFGYGNNFSIIVVILCMNTESRNPMENINPDNNPLLNPKFDLKTQEGVKGFLGWLFDPEVDEAFRQAFPIDESEQSEN